jgi:GT2 family glycosyltransferase
MQVSFVIPLFNGLALTRECLRTLQATLPAGLAHEIVLVDDGSADGTRDWLATLAAPVRVLCNERNLGFAGACNRGAAAATGELLFFLNNDLVLASGWFEPMADLLRARADTGLVGNVQLRVATGQLDHAGVTFDAKGKPAHNCTRPLLARLRGWREVPAVTGACLGVRRAVWERLGGFDDGFRNGGEDIDLCLRARAAGLRTLVSLRSVVHHHVSASAGRKLRDEENSRRLARRWRSEIARLSARAWSRQYLVSVWHGTYEQPDVRLVLEALGVALGVLGPTARTLAGADAALAVEFARWAELLDGAAPAPAPAPAPARGRRAQL